MGFGREDIKDPLDTLLIMAVAAILMSFVAFYIGYFVIYVLVISTLLAALYWRSNQKRPAGPSGYGVRHTGEDVTKGVDLSGKVAIVTGSTSGIGEETARVLALRGAEVVLAARNPKKLEKTKKMIELSLAEHGKKAVIHTIKLDLGSQQSVREFADEFKQLDLDLHLLINNAGIMALKRRGETEEGIEKQMGVCHVGHFLLTELLMPILIRSAPARVVVLTSSAHRFALPDFLKSSRLESDTYHSWTAYGNAKMANILFAREVSNRYKDQGVTAFSVHPGGIHTGLQGDVDWDIKLKWLLATPFFFKSIPQGAATSLYCATKKGLERRSGEFFQDCNKSKTNNPQVALSNKNAKLLWDLTEQLLDE